MKNPVLHTSFAAALLAALMPAMAAAGLYGSQVPDRPGTRIVDLDRTKTVNVDCGDVVTFRAGAQTFTWRFDVRNHGIVNLGDIAPAGFPRQSVRIYVAGNEGELTSGA